MRIGGLQKFSLIDYPGKMSAVIFTQGCNFRCPYCYNTELVIPKQFGPTIPELAVMLFLARRRSYLEGVVMTGGEPTQQADLIPFLDKIKKLGYLIKLDTNGSHPRTLKKLIQLKLVDYIAMDVKAPLAKYNQVAGVNVPVEPIQESIQLILHAGIEYEFRTTLVRPLCSQDDLAELLRSIEGVQRYTIQRFIPCEKVLDQTLLGKDHYSQEEIEEIKIKWERQSTPLTV